MATGLHVLPEEGRAHRRLGPSALCLLGASCDGSILFRLQIQRLLLKIIFSPFIILTHSGSFQLKKKKSKTKTLFPPPRPLWSAPQFSSLLARPAVPLTMAAYELPPQPE